MAASDQGRVSTDIEEGERDSLLGNNERGVEVESGNWKDYPAKIWAQTSSYVESLRHASSERGKRRQVDTEREGPGSLHIPTEQENRSRLQNLKTNHPHLYLTLVILSSLILFVLFLLVLVLLTCFSLHFVLRIKNYKGGLQIDPFQ